MAPVTMKLKLTTSNQAGSPDGGVPPTPGSVASSSGGAPKPKLKLKSSQPPTPATEQAAATLPTDAGATQAKSRSNQAKGKKAAGGGSKKRAANDDSISPAPKRPNKGTAPTRKISLKAPVAPPSATGAADQAPPSASNKLLLRRKSTQPKLRTINVKRPPPPRLPGHGYDSEDSEAEEDPAIQQAFILRMEPGEDCDYIREAIAKGTIGLQPQESAAEVSLRFLDKDSRRAIVTVRGRMYAAVLVELPCIVETMKSWDKRGWWKVADISQMLLVLGRCSGDEEAKNFRLPAEVEKNNFHYAHGLTPPMRWVRRRRFRKRLSYKTIANVEEEVERLLKEDEQTEREGGEVTLDYFDRRSELEQSEEPEQQQRLDEDEEDDAFESVEREADFAEYSSDEGETDLIGQMELALAQEEEDDDTTGALSSNAAATADSLVPSAPLPDQAATFTAVSNAMATSSASPLPPETPADATTQDEASPSADTSDEEDSGDDDDDDEDEPDSPDVMDEDALARAAERNAQLEELADLQREVEAQRTKVENMKNQLLKERAVAQLRTLEEDLRVKRAAVTGGDGDGEDDEGEDGG